MSKRYRTCGSSPRTRRKKSSSPNSEKLKTAKLLHGFRNLPPVDVETAAEVAQRLGRLMLARPDISEIEINPLMVHARGQGATALDALIVVD